MEGKFFKTAEFLAVHEEWRVKLKESGFNDIEYIFPDGNVSPLIKPALGTGSWPVDYRKAQTRTYYFSMAAKFLWDYPFKKSRHKHVWRLHSLGLSLRQIQTHIPGEHNAHRILQRIMPDFFKYIKALQEYEDNE